MSVSILRYKVRSRNVSFDEYLHIKIFKDKSNTNFTVCAILFLLRDAEMDGDPILLEHLEVYQQQINNSARLRRVRERILKG
jgi:hypothetical protein